MAMLMTRSEFINHETRRRIAYEAEGWDVGSRLVYSSVQYRCECGYVTTSAGELYDHVMRESAQISMLLEVDDAA